MAITPQGPTTPEFITEEIRIDGESVPKVAFDGLVDFVCRFGGFLKTKNESKFPPELTRVGTRSIAMLELRIDVRGKCNDANYRKNQEEPSSRRVNKED